MFAIKVRLVGLSGMRMMDLDRQKSNWDIQKAYLLSTVRNGIKMSHWDDGKCKTCKVEHLKALTSSVVFMLI